MPEGPFGFPRLTSVGPFSKKTDGEVAGEYLETEGLNRRAEADIRRTIIDLDNATGAGRPKIEVTEISTIAQFGHTGSYNRNREVITLSYEPVYLAASEGGDWEGYLKALVAHEYGHFILDRPDDEVREIINKMYEEGLFDYEDLYRTVNFYDFDEEDYKHYSDVSEFIDHILSYTSTDASRPVEGFCNSIAHRYTDMSFQRYKELHDKVRERMNEIGDKFMYGGYERGWTTRELWEIEW